LVATLLTAILLFASPAHAQDDEDLFAAPPPKKKETESAPSFTDDGDIEIAAAPPPPPKVTTAAAAAPAGGPLPLDLKGKAPLGDHFAPTIAFRTSGALVVDLPVVLAADAAGFTGAPWWLVVEAVADGVRVAETRSLVHREGLAAGAPSLAWTRLFVPVKQKSGLVELRIGKAATPEAKPSLLLTRSVPYGN
jgi:hypothetical protein